jgi:hypothetical protein
MRSRAPQYVDPTSLHCDQVGHRVTLTIGRTPLSPAVSSFAGCTGHQERGCPAKDASGEDRCPYYKALAALARPR